MPKIIESSRYFKDAYKGPKRYKLVYASYYCIAAFFSFCYGNNVVMVHCCRVLDSLFTLERKFKSCMRSS